jgi:two-component system, LytTR family, response regulator
MQDFKKHYFVQFDDPELFNKIIFLEADKNYTIIYFINGQSKRSAYNLLVFEKLFNSDSNFRRIHKTFIVNASHIDSVNFAERNLTLQTGKVLPISRRKLKMHKELQS